MQVQDIETEALSEIEQALRQKRAKPELFAQIRDILTGKFAEIGQEYQSINDKLRDLIEEKPGELIGNSREMREVSKRVRHIANSEATVLIRGKTGTGKEHAARSIHLLSDRKDKPFVLMNCDSLSDDPGANNFESELFGYERGAFAGATSRHIGKAEHAREGTLFLDEIGKLGRAAQARLLQFVQERGFCRLGSNIYQRCNARIIASTCMNLEQMLQEGTFREDLYYRLNIFQINLPDLAQRKTDILLLADHFIEKMNLKYGKGILRLSSPAIDMLMSYHWPGNVRELENCIEHACLATTDTCINAHDLPPTLQTGSASNTALIRNDKTPLATILDNFEREILNEALKRNDGNLSAAGRELSVSPRMMHYKVKRLGIA